MPAALASLDCHLESNPTALISRFVRGEPLTWRKIGRNRRCLRRASSSSCSTDSAKGAPLDAAELRAWRYCHRAADLGVLYGLQQTLRRRLSRAPRRDADDGGRGAVGLPRWRCSIQAMLTRFAQMGQRGWIAALFATVVAFVLGYILWYRGLRALSPSQARSISISFPFSVCSRPGGGWTSRPTAAWLARRRDDSGGVGLTNSGGRRRARHRGFPRWKGCRPVPR